MAKLTGPFFSLKASGQLGKTLVAFPWKGLNCLRTYVIPANPKTSGQVTQRGYFTNSVAEWHGAAYNALDVGAWNRLAGIAADIMSGFNRMIRSFVDEAILGNTWERLYQAIVSAVLATSFDVSIKKASAGNAPTLYWGTSKTHMPNSLAMTDMTGDLWSATASVLTANTLYYFYIDVGATGVDYARTGIYSQRTTA